MNVGLVARSNPNMYTRFRLLPILARISADPDHGADSVEPDAELVDNRWVGGGHTAPRRTEATGQGAVPSRERRETARRGDYTGNE